MRFSTASDHLARPSPSEGDTSATLGNRFMLRPARSGQTTTTETTVDGSRALPTRLLKICEFDMDRSHPSREDKRNRYVCKPEREGRLERLRNNMATTSCCASASEASARRVCIWEKQWFTGLGLIRTRSMSVPTTPGASAPQP